MQKLGSDKTKRKKFTQKKSRVGNTCFDTMYKFGIIYPINEPHMK